MVDFNADNTISTPAGNVVKILILQARANAMEALEFYNKQNSSGIEANQAMLRARLASWFVEHQAYLKRVTNKKEDKEEIDKIANQLFFNSKDLTNNELLKIVFYLNQIVDKLRITRVDTKKQYDHTKIEQDNLNNKLM